ncbi:MAG: tRNA pseudouridine(55) synthase TruB [Thermodesulfobacteriota bacterium]
MDGVLVIDKPAGITSHDVVSAVKKKLRAKKVGHLGTLDPAATGVLPLVIDGATRYARFFSSGQKEYLATMELGVETDTLDADGKVVGTKSTEGVTEDAVREALGKFVGPIRQVPPMYSAVKKGGTPLYKLARKGLTVEREAKEVEIFSIEVLDIALPLVTFNVACSGGTYIRTLCHDAGALLECGAHLKELRRTVSGAFLIDDSLELAVEPELLKESIIPIQAALGRALKEVELSADAADKVDRGTTLIGLGDTQALAEKEMVILMRSSRLKAIASYKGDGVFKIEKLFSTGTVKILDETRKVRANDKLY